MADERSVTEEIVFVREYARDAARRARHMGHRRAAERFNSVEEMAGMIQHRVGVLIAERRLLARLAAETPQFNNPLEIWGAQRVRDAVLAERASKADDAR